MLQGLPGFRDFYPEDCALRNHFFRLWRETARAYGFDEFDGPALEPLELFTRKSGQEIVSQATTPVYCDGCLQSRHFLLRVFLVPESILEAGGP